MEIELQMADDGNSSEGNIWDYFQKEPTMTGTEIAYELGHTRQNVSNTMKRIMIKSMKVVKRIEPDKDLFECAVHVAKILGVDFSIQAEVKKYFMLFPPKLKLQIINDAKNRMEAGCRRLSIL